VCWVFINLVPDLHHSGVPTSTNNSHATLPVVTTTEAQNKQKGPPPKSLTSQVSHMRTQEVAATLEASSNTLDITDPQIASLPSPSSNVEDSATDHQVAVIQKKSLSVHGTPDKTAGTSEVSQTGSGNVHLHADDNASVVSSITGAGFDQEIVKELLMALTEL
jgi:hypothetical protein